MRFQTFTPIQELCDHAVIRLGKIAQGFVPKPNADGIAIMHVVPLASQL
jgi:hypothetical protein